MSGNLYRKTTNQNVFLILLLATLIILLSFTLILNSHRFLQSTMGDLDSDPSESPSQYTGFLVKTKNCKIPNLDPFESSVKNYFQFNGPLHCPDKPMLTYQDDNMLRINWTAVKVYKLNDFRDCQYQPIIRPNQSSDFIFEYIQDGIRFSNDIEVKHEFMRVMCYSTSGGLMYTNFHSFILRDDNLVNQRLNSLLSAPPVKEKMNILLIGVDSISRLNFIRQMPRTRRYILDQLGAYEMNGYNKVADNTFVNIVPLTTGKYVKELPWNEKLAKEPFDRYNFIWKNYSDNGYMTMYAEDAPSISIFDYLKAGFHQPPCDHYNRPFFLAMVRNKALWLKNKNCVLNRLETDFILKYIYDFTKVYHDKPHMAFAFITRLTHDNINSVGYADEPYYNFFNQMEQEGRLNNSVVFFYSDHGSRFGKFRSTYLGKLEERLPFMFILFPKWFIQRYPEIDKVLKINSYRLTTPFDIYETLVDILYFDGKVQKATIKDRGISLFHEIPEERSCNDASILPHWCTCLQRIPVNTTDVIVEKIALSLVSRINKMTHHVQKKCAFLQLKTVKEAAKMIATDKILRFQKSLNDVLNQQVFYGNRVDAIVDYQLTVETTPGGAQFETTARYDEQEGTFTLMEEVSRVNSYGSQSSCIDILALKMYCFCGG